MIYIDPARGFAATATRSVICGAAYNIRTYTTRTVLNYYYYYYYYYYYFPGEPGDIIIITITHRYSQTRRQRAPAYIIICVFISYNHILFADRTQQLEVYIYILYYIIIYCQSDARIYNNIMRNARILYLRAKN